MNDLELAFWLFFEVAFALTHFKTRIFGTFFRVALPKMESKQLAAKRRTEVTSKLWATVITTEDIAQ